MFAGLGMFAQTLPDAGPSGGITLVGTNTGGGTTSMPAGLLEGDYVVLQTAADNYDPSGVSGWDLIQERLSSARGFLVAKFMGASPDTEVVLDSRLSVCVMAFRGVDQATPQDVPNTSSFTGSSSAPNPPSITPASDGCGIVISASLDDKNEGGSVTAPTGFQDVISSSDGSESATAMMAWTLQATAAAIDPAAFGSGSDENWTATQALRPAS